MWGVVVAAYQLLKPFINTGRYESPSRRFETCGRVASGGA
jgi:hypothetical protein